MEEKIASIWLLYFGFFVCLVWFVWASRNASKNDVHKHKFSVGEEVRFSTMAHERLNNVDNRTHTVKKVFYVTESFIGILNYPVERGLVGHSQTITLENGKSYSGVWLCPVA